MSSSFVFCVAPLFSLNYIVTEVSSLRSPIPLFPSASFAQNHEWPFFPSSFLIQFVVDKMFSPPRAAIFSRSPPFDVQQKDHFSFPLLFVVLRLWPPDFFFILLWLDSPNLAPPFPLFTTLNPTV